MDPKESNVVVRGVVDPLGEDDGAGLVADHRARTARASAAVGLQTAAVDRANQPSDGAWATIGVSSPQNFKQSSEFDELIAAYPKAFQEPDAYLPILTKFKEVDFSCIMTGNEDVQLAVEMEDDEEEEEKDGADGEELGAE